MTEPRPSLDEMWLSLLRPMALRSTCPRRQVAAIITDEKGQLLASGYNGVPSGIDHCIDVGCAGRHDPKGDTSRCVAVHAEQNALLQLGERVHRAHTMYVTCTPCFTCTKLICNTPIRRIVFLEPYADASGFALLGKKGVKLIQAS